MAKYVAGRGRGGLDTSAVERLRLRHQQAGLPSAADDDQASKLLGGGARKIQRCGDCTRPLLEGDTGFICSRCKGPELAGGNSSGRRGAESSSRHDRGRDKTRSRSRSPQRSEDCSVSNTAAPQASSSPVDAAEQERRKRRLARFGQA